MEQQTIEITAELIEEEEGYTVYCPELDIYTQGEDVGGAVANLKEAVELHIEEIEHTERTNRPDPSARAGSKPGAGRRGLGPAL